ncbi:MAG TPA: YfhO family protein, partial [Gemmatimonadaceae bacterium]|nr:YfhO family protein [Gemmatimonadaceae bacterium]
PVGAASRDAMLSGDGLMVHDVRQAIGYHGNELGRFRRLTCGGQDCGGASLVGPLQSANIRSLLNVRYLAATLAPDNDTLQAYVAGAPLQRVAGPVRNARGSMVYVYRYPGDNAPAWVASGALKAPDDASLATLLDPRFNEEMLRRVAIVDTASAMRTLPGPESVPAASPITATVTRPTHSRIVVQLSQPAQEGNVLVVSENFYPGWQATVDGQAAVAERVDYVLTGVPLRAGARQIELSFRDPKYDMGKLITIVAVILALAAVAAGIALDRRRRPAPAA